jgi:hypothetical protein
MHVTKNLNSSLIIVDAVYLTDDPATERKLAMQMQLKQFSTAA